MTESSAPTVSSPPLSAKGAGSSRTVVTPEEVSHARILIADDEMSIRMGCEKILKSMGHDVVTVEDGLLALQAFDEKPFDLVLLDLMMPRMDGLTVIPELKARDSDVVIIMITGYASFETAVKAIQSGAYDYVPKPFTPNELKIVIGRALERRHLLRRTRELQLERERSLKDLAFEQSRTKSIINAMADALLVVNNRKELVLFNPSARAFLKDGATPSGKPLVDVSRLPALLEAFDKAIPQLNESMQAVSLEVEDTERKKTFLMNVAFVGAGAPATDGGESLGTDSGEMRGAVVVLSDISPMKDLERAKSRFVSIVSHELKAPVAAIEGYLELIVSDLPPELDKYRQKLDRCKDRAGLLQRMIRELLDLTRIEQGHIERHVEILDPVPVVQEAAEFLRSEASKRHLTLELPSGNGTKVRGDRGEITQIFTNLVSNAIKYNRDGGQVLVKSNVADGFWRLSVSDTGIGMSPENLAHVGEEFFRVKSSATINISGTGLGMSIVQRLLHINHARMEITSELEKGTTFTVVWPLES
ncbi:MAG: response regulator [Candidatus Ozemobacteraceae bacterium]